MTGTVRTAPRTKDSILVDTEEASPLSKRVRFSDLNDESGSYNETQDPEGHRGV